MYRPVISQQPAAGMSIRTSIAEPMSVADALVTVEAVNGLAGPSVRRPLTVSWGTGSVLDEAIAAIREFVENYAMRPTAKTWTEPAMRPSEKTIRRRFGSFRKAIEFAVSIARPFDDPPLRRHPVPTAHEA